MTGEMIAKLVAHLDDPEEGAVVLGLLRHEATAESLDLVDLLYRGEVVLALNKQLNIPIGQNVITALIDALAKKTAEFDNFRLRTEREKKDWMYYHEKGKS